jgi:putative sensor protein/histidine kinase/DNA gyrase B/HSP90-like ATPase
MTLRLARRIGADTVYLLLGFPLALVSFGVIVTGLSVGVGSLLLLFGLPLVVLTLYAARAFAELERVRIRPVLPTRKLRPRYRATAPDASFLRRMFTPLVDGQYWLDLVHGLVVFGVSAATFTIAVTWWCTAVFGLAYAVFGWFLPAHTPIGIVINDEPLTSFLGMGESTTSQVVMNFAVGLFFLGTLPWVLRGMALLQAYLGRVMLFVPFTVAKAPPKPIPAITAGPISVDYDLPVFEELDSTAYRVIAEAVDNVQRHSGAERCRVSVERLGQRLMVIVVDDGRGGATVVEEHGLADVEDAVRACGGTLTVDSPAGGPTTITAELPYKQPEFYG